MSLWWVPDAVRLGDLVLDLDSPGVVPTTRLDLEPLPCSRQAPPPDRQIRTALRRRS